MCFFFNLLAFFLGELVQSIESRKPSRWASHFHPGREPPPSGPVSDRVKLQTRAGPLGGARAPRLCLPRVRAPHCVLGPLPLRQDVPRPLSVPGVRLLGRLRVLPVSQVPKTDWEGNRKRHTEVGGAASDASGRWLPQQQLEHEVAQEEVDDTGETSPRADAPG